MRRAILLMMVVMLAAACGDDGGRRGGSGGSGGDAGSGGTGGVGAGGAGGELPSGPSEADASQSGSRLRVRYLDAGDGARMTVGLWDSELEMECEFREAGDGALRCLPDEQANVVFADADCTEPIINAAACSDWASDQAGTVYRRTATPATVGESYYYQSGGRCVETFRGPDQEFQVAERVGFDAFVRGEWKDEARSGGMVTRYAEGEDGSRILVETLHATRGYRCRFDQSGHCTPDALEPHYLDASCRELIVDTRGSTPQYLVVTEYDASKCETGVAVYERGASVSPTSIYVRSMDGSCEEGTPGTAATYFRAGERRSLDAVFAPASVEHEGRGALRAMVRRDADGALLGTAHDFWDAERDEVCKPFALPDGGFACIADHATFWGDMYADSSCSGPNVAIAYCMPRAPEFLVHRSHACAPVSWVPSVVDVFERGAEVEGYWVLGGTGACLERPLDAFAQAWRTGPSALGSLPRLELKVE